MDTNSWWIPNQSKVSAELNHFVVDLNMDLFVQNQGYLRPKIYNARIDWGDSYFYHDNWFIQTLLHEVIIFTMIMLQNSVLFIGDIVFTRLGEPVMTKFLNDYKLPLKGIPSPFYGQPATADFTLDFRNTMNPVVRNGIIDFKFFGEILYQGHICQLEAEPFDFLEDEEGYIIS